MFRLLGLADLGDDIGDFASGIDALELAATAFFPAGALDPADFAFGAATVAGAQLVYKTATGRLSIDLNGIAAGRLITILTLIGAPTLAAADIVFLAWRIVPSCPSAARSGAPPRGAFRPSPGGVAHSGCRGEAPDPLPRARQSA